MSIRFRSVYFHYVSDTGLKWAKSRCRGICLQENSLSSENFANGKALRAIELVLGFGIDASALCIFKMLHKLP